MEPLSATGTPSDAIAGRDRSVTDRGSSGRCLDYARVASSNPLEDGGLDSDLRVGAACQHRQEGVARTAL